MCTYLNGRYLDYIIAPSTSIQHLELSSLWLALCTVINIWSTLSKQSGELDVIMYTGTQQRYRTNVPWRQNPRFQIYVYFWWKRCTTNKVIPQQYRVAESSPVHHKKPMCYVKKAILQNPRFTTQVHTKHNQPRYTVYNLNWNQKQAVLTKSKHSIALSKAASYHKANHWS